MAIRQMRPYTATTRFQSYIKYREVLTTSEPYKGLLEALPKKAGRNNNGRIVVRHKGGGNKRKYRVIDWKRTRRNIEGVVTSVEYDPNRTAFISLVQYKDGDRRYHLATFATTHGVIDRVHRNTTNRRTYTLPTSAAGFTQRNVHVVGV